MKLAIRNSPRSSSVQETSQPSALGGSGHRIAGARGDCRCLHLSLTQTDTSGTKHCGKEYRRIALRKSQRRESERLLCGRHSRRDSDSLGKDLRPESDFPQLDSTFQTYTAKCS